MRCQTLLLLLAAACLLAAAAAVPSPGKKGLKFDFKTPGSAKAHLGEQKLARIAKRSGQTQAGVSIDQLATQIETEDDLVRRAVGLHGPACVSPGVITPTP